MVVVNVEHGNFRLGRRWRPHSTCGLLLVRLDGDGDIVDVAVPTAERWCGVMTWWTAEECNAEGEGAGSAIGTRASPLVRSVNVRVGKHGPRY